MNLLLAGSTPVFHPKHKKRRITCYEEHELYQEQMQRYIIISLRLFEGIFIDAGLEEVIFPNIWNEETFTNKVGVENTNMMWKFADKKNRKVCLVPEITGMAQEMWVTDWSKTKTEYPIFYIQRCYRYERPQRGRYREFTQIGIELLGSTDVASAKSLLIGCLDTLDIPYTFTDNVERGLSYYSENGFEAAVSSLGAQKQIAGGGIYPEGVGWAVGVDRIMLAKSS